MKAFLSHSSAHEDGCFGMVASCIKRKIVFCDDVLFESGKSITSEVIRGLGESTMFYLFSFEPVTVHVASG